jgi:hypothetical protein
MSIQSNQIKSNRHSPMCHGTSGNDDRNFMTLRPAWSSGFALGNIFAHDAFVSLQFPLVIRAVGEPFGDADLGMDLAGSHGDARLITGGDDLLQAQRAVAENGDKSNEHGDLFLTVNPACQIHAGFVPHPLRAAALLHASAAFLRLAT